VAEVISSIETSRSSRSRLRRSPKFPLAMSSARSTRVYQWKNGIGSEVITWRRAALGAVNSDVCAVADNASAGADLPASAGMARWERLYHEWVALDFARGDTGRDRQVCCSGDGCVPAAKLGDVRP
jgi:hypothetical protein